MQLKVAALTAQRKGETTWRAIVEWELDGQKRAIVSEEAFATKDEAQKVAEEEADSVAKELNGKLKGQGRTLGPRTTLKTHKGGKG